MTDFRPDERLWKFTTPPTHKRGPRQPKPPRFFYCAACKSMRAIKTDKTNVTCRLHGCLMVHFGTGEEAERKARDTQRAGQLAKYKRKL